MFPTRTCAICASMLCHLWSKTASTSLIEFIACTVDGFRWLYDLGACDERRAATALLPPLLPCLASRALALVPAVPLLLPRLASRVETELGRASPFARPPPPPTKPDNDLAREFRRDEALDTRRSASTDTNDPRRERRPPLLLLFVLVRLSERLSPMGLSVLILRRPPPSSLSLSLTTERLLPSRNPFLPAPARSVLFTQGSSSSDSPPPLPPPAPQPLPPAPLRRLPRRPRRRRLQRRPYPALAVGQAGGGARARMPWRERL